MLITEKPGAVWLVTQQGAKTPGRGTLWSGHGAGLGPLWHNPRRPSTPRTTTLT